MSTLDVILLVAVGLFMLRGLWRGFVRESIGLVALLVAGLAATTYAHPLGEALVSREAVRRELAPLVAGTGLFIAVYVAVNLAGLVVDRLARTLFLGPLLRIAGMAFAALKASLLLGLALVAGQRVVPSLLGPAEIGTSRLARPMMDLATVVLDFGGGWIGAVGETPEGATT